jgi:hypothetical protein
MGAAAIIMQLIAMLPTAVQATTQVISIAKRTRDIIDSGREPTDEDWNAVNAEIASLTAELNKDPE